MVYNKIRELQAMDDHYLTVKETATLLQVHWQTIHNYIRAGKIEAYKIGNGYRISQPALRKFLRVRKAK